VSFMEDLHMKFFSGRKNWIDTEVYDFLSV